MLMCSLMLFSNVDMFLMLIVFVNDEMLNDDVFLALIFFYVEATYEECQHKKERNSYKEKRE